MNTNDFLDAVKARHGLTSDYQLGKKMNWTSSRIANYRMGRSGMDEAACLEIAEALGMNALEVVAEINAEKAKEKGVQEFWRQVAKSARAGLAAGLVLFMGSMVYAHPLPVQAAASVYYDKKRRARRRLTLKPPHPDLFRHHHAA